MSQSESNNSPLGMRIGESVFCIGYLVFALIAGIVMLSRYDGNQWMLMIPKTICYIVMICLFL